MSRESVDFGCIVTVLLAVCAGILVHFQFYSASVVVGLCAILSAILTGVDYSKFQG